MKLGVKISILLFLCIGIIYAILNFYTSTTIQNKLEGALTADMSHASKLFTATVEAKQRAVEEIIQSSATAVQMMDSEEKINQFLYNQIKNNTGDIYGIGLASNPTIENKAIYFFHQDEKVKTKDLADDNYRYKEWEWFEKAFESKTDSWSEPYFDKEGGEILMSTYSHPILYDDKVKWIITGDISLDGISNQLNLFQKDNYSRWIFISDNDGEVLTIPDNWDKPFGVEKLLQNKPKNSSSSTYHAKIDETDFFVLSTHIPRYNWNVNVVFDYKIIKDEILEVSKFNTIVFAIGALLILITIAIISHIFTKPIHKLSEIIKTTGSHGFDTKIPFTEKKGEVGNLARSFSEMQSELKLYIQNIQEEEAYKQRIESELAIARNIQQNSSPNMNLVRQEFPNLSFETYLESAKEVGGDLYDCFKLSENKLFFFMGDVSGKGVPAAMYMNGIRSFIRAILKNTDEKLDEAISKLNNELCEKNDLCMFTTFFCGILDTSNGILEFINAGHPLPFLIHKNKVEELTQNGHAPALGVIKDYTYQSQSIQMNPTDIFFLYTDGIPDTINNKNEFFGVERLKNILLTTSNSTEEIKQRIISELTNFTEGMEQYDDSTLFIFKINQFKS